MLTCLHIAYGCSQAKVAELRVAAKTVCAGKPNIFTIYRKKLLTAGLKDYWKQILFHNNS